MVLHKLQLGYNGMENDSVNQLGGLHVDVEPGTEKLIGDDEEAATTAAATPKARVKVPKHLQSAPLKKVKHPTERSLVLSFLLSILAVTLAIIIGVPFMIATTAVLYPLTILLRLAINNGCQCLRLGTCRCHLKTTGLAPNDALWLHANPFGANVAHTLLFFEAPSAGQFGSGCLLTKLKELILRKVVLAEDPRGGRLYPRFQQRIVPMTAGYRWTDDDCFDIHGHVKAPLPPDVILTRQGLQQHLADLVNQGLPLDRPPWEVLLLPDYRGVEGTAVTSAAVVLIVRTHLALSDAISLIRILERSLADVPSSCGSSSAGQAVKARFGGTTFPLNVFRAFIVGPMTLLSWMLGVSRDCNLLSHGQPFTGVKRLAWSDDVSLAQVVRIKQVSRSTLNDVILAALTGSLRDYFQSHGIARPFKLKANLAVDLRYEPGSRGKRPIKMGTKFALVNIPLPTNQEGAIPRLWEVRSIMDDLKTSADPVIMYGAINLLETFLPQCLSSRIVGRILSRASFLVNNIPGPDHAFYSLAMRLRSIVCLVPPRDAVPLSFTVATNADVLTLAVLADEAVMDDPKTVVDGFVAQINLMSSLLASRRIPGEHRRRSIFIVSANHFKQNSPLEQIQHKLHAVQDELHEITQKLDASTLSQYLTEGSSEGLVTQQHLRTRMEELKEEFSELLGELRRRKSLADGISLSDEEEDLDGELRRPRKRTLSMTSRKSSISVTSTARPLTTPTTSYHSSLAIPVDGDSVSSEQISQTFVTADEE